MFEEFMLDNAELARMFKGAKPAPRNDSVVACI